jgi:hypothetical protein
MRIARADRIVAALLLAASMGASAAIDLGTLFTSAEERDRLDRLRRGDPVQLGSGHSGQRAVTGYVKRSDGRSTVWIDGVPLQVATPKAGPMLDPGAVRTSPGADDNRIRLERRPPAR